MSAPSVLFANWRDTLHPEGGGSERYVEKMAAGLVSRGCRVTVLCARHDNAPPTSTVDGVRFIRRGNKFTVYLWALLTTLLTRPDVVVDVQNGMPFFCRLVTRRPVIVLVHHLHRLQWCWTFGESLGGVGWWIESRLAPWVYRRSRYVTVSEHTKAELVDLGVAAERITLVCNGLDPVPETHSPRSAVPLMVAVSRLVPHKRLEHAIETIARLGDEWPDLNLEVIGRGPWLEPLRDYARQRGVAGRVTFHGWVDESDKHEILARAWVHLCPSVKEGWGIVVMEAGAHCVPTVAYRAAGGVCESILENRTGLLVDDLDGFVSGVELQLRCATLREAMGVEARVHARQFQWDRSVAAFAELVMRAAGALPEASAEAAAVPVVPRQRSGLASPAQR